MSPYLTQVAKSLYFSVFSISHSTSHTESHPYARLNTKTSQIKFATILSLMTDVSVTTCELSAIEKIMQKKKIVIPVNAQQL